MSTENKDPFGMQERAQEFRSMLETQRDRADKAERQRDAAQAKLDAIGQLCPAHFDDREKLLAAITRILRGRAQRGR